MASVWTANVFAKRVGKALTAVSWTKRPDNACQIALDMEGSIWRHKGVIAFPIGLVKIVRKGYAIWIVGSMGGE